MLSTILWREETGKNCRSRRIVGCCQHVRSDRERGAVDIQVSHGAAVDYQQIVNTRENPRINTIIIQSCGGRKWIISLLDRGLLNLWHNFYTLNASRRQSRGREGRMPATDPPTDGVEPDEHNISTSQEEAQEHPRVPCAHGHEKRPESSCAAARARPEEADGQRRTLGEEGRNAAGAWIICCCAGDGRQD